MTAFYDALETRSADERQAAQTQALRAQVGHAKAKGAYWAETLAEGRRRRAGRDGDGGSGAALRLARADGGPGGLRARLVALRARLPCGGLPQGGGVVLNSFRHHLTPACHMFESAAHALTLKIEAEADLDPATLAETAQAVFKLKAAIEPAAPGALPNDGKVIEDARDFES